MEIQAPEAPYWIIEMTRKVLRQDDQRMIDCTYFYIKRAGEVQVGNQNWMAARFRKELAQTLCDKLNADPAVTSVYHTIKLNDSWDTGNGVFTELWQVGEAEKPLPKPSAVPELHRIIEKLFDEGLTQLDIFNECAKAILQG